MTTQSGFVGHSFERVGAVQPERDAGGRILEVRPSTNQPLHKYGAGPFCRFQIAQGVSWRRGGVYVLACRGAAHYVGECKNLAEIWRNVGHIKLTSVGQGGHPTFCRLNNLILEETKAGAEIVLWFLHIEDVARRTESKARIIDSRNPPWNLQVPRRFDEKPSRPAGRQSAVQTPRTQAQPAATPPRTQARPAAATPRTQAQPAAATPRTQAQPAAATPRTQPAFQPPLTQAQPAAATPQTQAQPAAAEAGSTVLSEGAATGEGVFGGLQFSYVGPVLPERDARGRVIGYSPHSRFSNPDNQSLNRYGKGPFCRFQVAKGWERSGVYVLTRGSDLCYIGECENLERRWGATGYGQISPRACYRGGRDTNCRINNLIYRETRTGGLFHLWFYPLEGGKNARLGVEGKLINDLTPPWNRT